MARSAKPKDRPSLALELALAKLGTSGLDAADFAALKLKVWEGPETAGIDGSFPAVPSLEFPYLDPFNKWAPLAPKPKWPPVRRFRLLQEVKRIAGRGPLRYVQPEGTGVCAYFPPSVDWAEIARNPAQTVLITEGELKAAKPDCRTVVGGAVLTADYAAQIGATYYAKDAMATVRVAEEVFK